MSQQKQRSAILLVNLGTPDAASTAAVRRYLAEFLWDPRVVEFPRPLWWLVLHAVILRFRPAKVARAYQSIWTEQGSPLLVISMQQAAALEKALSGMEEPPLVELAMRYGTPSISQALRRLREQGAGRLYVLPMYPQYSATTTASVYDEIFRLMRGWREMPEMHLIQRYHNHPSYIRALANSVREFRQEHGEAQKLLLSFHGIPRRYVNAGDPYERECRQTAQLLASELQLEDGSWQLAFQSRFGKEEWLKPYADFTLRDWGQQGVKSVQVLCPGFSADCLETLEEISEQNRDLFLENGGEHYSYIPALNDRVDHIDALRDILLDHGYR